MHVEASMLRVLCYLGRVSELRLSLSQHDVCCLSQKCVNCLISIVAVARSTLAAMLYKTWGMQVEQSVDGCVLLAGTWTHQVSDIY